MIYKLKITSWADRSRGYQSSATHYFATIRIDGQREPIYLEHEVEIRNPAYLDSSLRCYSAKPGDMMSTNRFQTREECWEAARKWLAENANPKEDSLVEI